MVKIFAAFLTFTSNLFGQITLSEVLSNEPGGRVRLEWIEIYNRLPSDLDLHGFQLIVNGDTTRFPSGTIAGGETYIVIARQPIADNGSDSFEAYWGDSSGVWGDGEGETYRVYQGNVQLSNNSGSVTLADSAGQFLDQFNWNAASDDGRSAEKDDISLDFTSWHKCFDPGGSTPGEANSIVPDGGAESFSAEIAPKLISTGVGGPADRFSISIIVPSNATVSVEVFDDSGARRKTLAENVRTPLFEIAWDGSDNAGGFLSPGVYIVAISLSGQKTEHKFIPVVIAP